MDDERAFEVQAGAYGAFIFDCDGTLADSMPLHHAAWKRAFQDCNAAIDFSWERFVSRAGKTLEVTVEELNQELGLSLDPGRVAAIQRAEYDRLLSGVGPVESVVSFLRSVAGKRPVSVASGSNRQTVDRTLLLLGIADLVPIVVTAEEVEHGKPAPDLFLLAAERMGMPAERCLVFEDSLLGIEAATRAGMGSVLVRAPA